MYRVKKVIKEKIPNSILMRRLKKSGSNSILLTFDDGPNEKLTPMILEKLRIYNARAIFFVVGRFAEDLPNLTKRIYEDGHLIGNHSYYHNYQDKSQSFKNYMNDVKKCQRIIKKIIGQPLLYYRPPQGVISFKAIYSSWFNKMLVMLWSKEGGEWSNNKRKQPERIAKKIMRCLEGRDIILLHDNNPKIPEILDLILPYMKLKGFDLYNGFNYLSKIRRTF